MTSRASEPRMDGRTGWQVFLGCLTLQASWNDQRMQNLGLLAAMAPWLRRQSLGREQLRRTCRRYYGYFNTNPYLAGFVVGGLLRLEHARGERQPVPDRLVAGFHDTMARACGSLGDQLVWLGLRPALMLAAVVLAASGLWPAALALVGLFAAGQLVLRRRWLCQAFALGPDVIEVLADPRWHRAIARVGAAALLLTGLVLGGWLAGVSDLAPAVGRPEAVGAVLIGLALPALVRQRASGELQALLALALAAGLAALT
jgi:PTS system mannose-specific IID component